MSELIAEENKHLYNFLKQPPKTEPEPDILDEEAWEKWWERQRNPLFDFVGTFDVNEFFTILDRLTMEPGYTLDYCYNSCSAHGFPVLYARKETDDPFADYKALKTSLESQSENEEKKEWFEYVVADGTKESFFQLYVLRVMGEQFYLYWHANYNDTVLLCDRSGIQKLLKTLDAEEKPNIFKQGRAFMHNCTPEVRFEENTVTVSVTIFSKWGGFCRHYVTLDRQFPHKIIEEKRDMLIEYNCNMRY